MCVGEISAELGSSAAVLFVVVTASSTEECCWMLSTVTPSMVGQWIL